MEGVTTPLCTSLVAGSAGSGIGSAMMISYNGGSAGDHGETVCVCVCVCVGSTSPTADWFGNVSMLWLPSGGSVRKCTRMKLS
jgi:hypothetical protein